MNLTPGPPQAGLLLSESERRTGGEVPNCRPKGPIAILGAMTLAVALLVWLLHATPGVQRAWAENHEPSVRSIGGKLQCPVCEGTSVADSASQVAEDMREVIRTKLAAGESESDIIQYFVASYGPGVLREPPATGFYSAVWWVPGLALLVGAAIIYGMVRHRRPAPDVAGEKVEVAPELSEEEMDRYRERLRELERGGS